VITSAQTQKYAAGNQHTCKIWSSDMRQMRDDRWRSTAKPGRRHSGLLISIDVLDKWGFDGKGADDFGQN